MEDHGTSGGISAGFAIGLTQADLLFDMSTINFCIDGSIYTRCSRANEKHTTQILVQNGFTYFKDLKGMGPSWGGGGLDSRLFHC